MPSERRAGLALAFLLLLPPFLAAEAPSSLARIEDLRRQAQVCEKRGDWLEACRWHEEIIRRDRTQGEYREAYHRCLRQLHLVRRHRDAAYRQALLRLTPSQALDLYEQILSRLMSSYVDRSRAKLTTLFQQGIEELRLGLASEGFQREFLAGMAPETIEAFRRGLDEWNDRKIQTRAEAREQVAAVARHAQQTGLTAKGVPMLGLLALEFACGACNSLDEHTLFLTPGHYSDLQASLRGRFVGIGVDLAVVEGRLEIGRVYPRGPAAEAGLLRRDRIVRIDRQAIESLPPDVAADRLRGEAGSQVELEVVSAGQMMPHSAKLVRRAVVAPSVEHDVINDGDEMGLIGIVRISSFQDSTPQEVKEALAQLQTLGIRVLILDVRGNPGGVFRSAVQVAELFLGEGVIVITQSQLREFNRPFRADAMNPFALPMVVLVDAETASSAEVVAGALKDHGRAVVVGQTTYGKGTIQCVLPLDRGPLEQMPAGIRLTVARFFSPLKVPYSGRGVVPDVLVDQEGETSLSAAKQEARRIAMNMTR